MKTFWSPLLWLIVLCAVFWGIAELLFYYIYTYGFIQSPVYITLVTILLIILYTVMIWLGFRSKYWYVSLFSMLLCPIVFFCILFVFGSMTKIVEGDYGAGFVGIVLFIYNQICLIISVIIGNALLIYHRTK